MRRSASDRYRQVAIVDERYASYNIEMAEIIGGNFWKPYDSSFDGPESATGPRSSGASEPDAQAFGIGGIGASAFEPRPPVDLGDFPWGSETRIRSRGGAVVLVDEPSEEIPTANVARTDGDQVPRFGSWRARPRARWGRPRLSCST